MLIHSFIHSPVHSRYTNLKFLTEDIEKSIIWWTALHLPLSLRFGVLTALLLKIQVLCNVVPCWLVITGLCLRWSFCRQSESSIWRKLLNLCSVQCPQSAVSPHCTVQCCLCMYTVYTNSTAKLGTWFWFLHAHWLFRVFGQAFHIKTFLWMLDPEDGGSLLLRKHSNFWTFNAVEHARRVKSSPKYKLFKRLVLDRIHWPKKIGVDSSTVSHSLFVLL